MKATRKTFLSVKKNPLTMYQGVMLNPDSLVEVGDGEKTETEQQDASITVRVGSILYSFLAPTGAQGMLMGVPACLEQSIFIILAQIFNGSSRE